MVLPSKLTATLVAVVVFTTAMIADGFAPAIHPGTTGSRLATTTKTTHLHVQAAVRGRGRGGTKPSPLLEDALSSYPYIFKTESEKADASSNFNELARLYGDEEALGMVKIEPNALKMQRENFAKTLDIFAEQFGLEASQAMVQRNPGLLGIPPWNAENAESCMAFSYVIAVTRPLPKIAAAGLLLALLTAGVTD